MPYIDQSGLYAMEDVLVDLVSNGKKVLIEGLIQQPKYMLERIDIIPDLIPEDQIFENIDESLLWVKDHFTA
jgi:SulP family sulfate permease